MEQEFVQKMLQIGIVSYKEQETLYQIAKRCASTIGIPAAGAGAWFGAKAGSPGLAAGAASGAAIGALVGLFAGTISCTMLNVSVRDELRKLAAGQ